MVKINPGFEKISDLIGRAAARKPPAHLWQEMALKIINELSVPNRKRNSVFKVCKDYPRAFIESCLNDTKELCQTGEKWKYFFKLIGENKK